MLQAWIVSRRESPYLTAAASPRTLAALHRHVRGIQRRRCWALRLRLSLAGSDVGIGAAGISAFLQRFAAEGVDQTIADAIDATVADTKESSGTLRPSGNGRLAARLAAARSDERGDRPGASPTTLPQGRRTGSS